MVVWIDGRKLGPLFHGLAVAGGAILLAGTAEAVAPTLSSVSPTTGPTIGGIPLTLTGSGFGTFGTVTVDGLYGLDISWSDTEIVCTRSSGSGANLPVVVTVAGRMSAPVSLLYKDAVAVPALVPPGAVVLPFSLLALGIRRIGRSPSEQNRAWRRRHPSRLREAFERRRAVVECAEPGGALPHPVIASANREVRE